MMKEIRELSDEIYEKVVDFRRHLHQAPELSFDEENTSKYVCQQLEGWGIPFQRNIGGYGIAGLIGEETSEGKVIALRADMDALPIQEENKVTYASRIPGVMHACGHDVHTASLLGTAYILQQMNDQIQGQVKLIFQPAEERLPGGASLMIKEGILQNPRSEERRVGKE